MKNAFLYSFLLLLLASCSNPTTTEEPTTTPATSTTEDGYLPLEDKAEVAIAEEAPSCGAFELEVYLADPDPSGTNVREKPGGAIVTQLKLDEDNEAYFLVLTEAKDGWFKVKNPIGTMEEDIELPNGAWIHGSVIGVGTRNYGGEAINLLDQPKNGVVVGSINKEVDDLHIKDVCGSWVQIEYKGTIGWVENSWLCGNPLTTCS